jgi:hypothetical protein
MKVYTTVAGLVWTQEAAHIWVVNSATRAIHQLTGVEAAVWDWLNNGHTGAETTRLLALTFDLAASDAQHTLEEVLARWHAAGLLETGEARHG